jgi:hypothetical protein
MPFKDPEKYRQYQRAYHRVYDKSDLARQRNKSWRQSEAGKVWRRAWDKANYERNAQKILCRHTTQQAIRSGELVRGPCEVCGCSDVEAHHDDYAKPLTVRWFCKADHEAFHHKEELARN